MREDTRQTNVKGMKGFDERGLTGLGEREGKIGYEKQQFKVSHFVGLLILTFQLEESFNHIFLQ